MMEMKIQNERNTQKFCGKELFTWDEWDMIDTGELQFYNVKFCIDSMKEFNGMTAVLSIEGQLDIFAEDEAGSPIEKWSGFITDIPGFLKGQEIYRVVHEYDDEFGFHEKETIAVCASEQKADEIIKENEELGLDKNESYWSLCEQLEV